MSLESLIPNEMASNNKIIRRKKKNMKSIITRVRKIRSKTRTIIMFKMIKKVKRVMRRRIMRIMMKIMNKMKKRISTNKKIKINPPCNNH